MNRTQKAYTVYILFCKDGSLYTGIARDLAARIAQHKKGTGARYTRARGVAKVAYREKAGSKSDALKREIVIKRLTRAQKLQLISAAGGVSERRVKPYS